MNRGILYFVIGALVVAFGIVGYLLYQERQQTAGIDIEVGKKGVTIETQ